MSIEQMLWNTDPQIILGLIGTGFLLSWLSEFIFSLIALLCEYVKKKIKGDKK